MAEKRSAASLILLRATPTKKLHRVSFLEALCNFLGQHTFGKINDAAGLFYSLRKMLVEASAEKALRSVPQGLAVKRG